MFLDEMLMVKIGGKDHQQVPPSWPLLVLKQNAGLA
jgi:hypothetical protein